jgi:hypothetical protein
MESVRGFNLMDEANPADPRVVAVVGGVSVADPATRAAVLQAKQKHGTGLLAVSGVMWPSPAGARC